MALKATIFKSDLQIADMDRHYYADHALTIARHPSETDERMMVRLLAFALNADPLLVFTKGLCADDEPELGESPVIASVSLGATRRLRIRPRGGGDSVAVDLEGGGLLLMSGRSQANWQHAVPKTRRVVGPRINLTFRKVIPR